MIFVCLFAQGLLLELNESARWDILSSENAGKDNETVNMHIFTIKWCTTGVQNNWAPV